MTDGALRCHGNLRQVGTTNGGSPWRCGALPSSQIVRSHFHFIVKSWLVARQAAAMLATQRRRFTQEQDCRSPQREDLADRMPLRGPGLLSPEARSRLLSFVSWPLPL